MIAECHYLLLILQDMNWPCVRHNIYLYGTETVYT